MDLLYSISCNNIFIIPHQKLTAETLLKAAAEAATVLVVVVVGENIL